MELTKIHKVLKFTQSEWMKKYIDFNTEKRMNVRVVNKTEDFLKYISNINYS